MSRWIDAGAAALLLLCSACQRQEQASAPTAKSDVAKVLPPGDPGYVAEDPRLARLIGAPGPAITLKTIDGRTIDVGRLYGTKPVYLKLWASYCIPCRVQMPGFEKIYETLGDRIEVIAVNAGIGDDTAKVRGFAEKNGMRMPVAIDDGSLGAWLKMNETPVHLLMGRDGRIAYAGHQDGAPLDAAIQRVLGAGAQGKAVAPVKVAHVAALKPGDVVPAIELRGPDGGTVLFRRGATDRPRALLFTSVWCEDYLQQTEPRSVAACRRVREDVDRLAPGGRVEWLGIVSHLWTTPKDLADYQARTKAGIPLAVDGDGMAFRLFGIHRFPAVALIDAKGRLVRILGPDDTGLDAAIRSAGRAG